MIKFTSDLGDTVTVEVNTERVVLHDVIQDFRTFLLAVGFHPDSVSEYIEEE